MQIYSILSFLRRNFKCVLSSHLTEYLHKSFGIRSSILSYSFVIYSIIYFIIIHECLFSVLSYTSILCYALCCWFFFQLWTLGGLWFGSCDPLSCPHHYVGRFILVLPYFLSFLAAPVHLYIPWPRPKISHFFKRP